MKRTAIIGNSVGSIKITFEGYGALKHELGYEEFGAWLDHQVDTISLLLPGAILDLADSKTTYGDTSSTSSFTVNQGGTIVTVSVEFALWHAVAGAKIDSAMDSLVQMLKVHLRVHLDGENGMVDPFDFEGVAGAFGDDPMVSLADILGGLLRSGGAPSSFAQRVPNGSRLFDF